MVFRLGATLGFCVIYKTYIQESMWEPEQKVDGVITKTKFNATKMIIPPILSRAFLSYLTQNKEFTDVTLRMLTTAAIDKAMLDTYENPSGKFTIY